MHGRAWRTASRFPELIGARGVRRVLDVGGGSGVYAMAFLAAGAAEAVVLDLPEVIALTKNYVAKAGLALQVFYIEGDYHTADFASGYDVVLFSAILHINSADENRALLRKASQALNSGGKVAVEDFILNDERTGPQRGTLFSLNMLVSTRAGDTYSEAEISSWMREAGLGEIVRHETGPGSALLVGRKP